MSIPFPAAQPPTLDHRLRQSLWHQVLSANQEAVSEDRLYPFVDTILNYFTMFLVLDKRSSMDVCPQYRIADLLADRYSTIRIAIPDFALRILTTIGLADNKPVMRSSTAVIVEVKRLYVVSKGRPRTLHWFTESCDWYAWKCLIMKENITQALTQGYLAMCLDKGKKKHHLIIIVGLFFTLLEFTQFDDAGWLPSAGDGTDKIAKDITTLLPIDRCPTVVFSNRPIFQVPRRTLLGPDNLAFNESFISSLINGIQVVNQDHNVVVGIAKDILPLFSNTVPDKVMPEDLQLYNFAQEITDFYHDVAHNEDVAMQYRNPSNPLVDSPPRNPNTNQPDPTWTRDTDDYSPTTSRTKKLKRTRTISPEALEKVEETGQDLFATASNKKPKKTSKKTRIIDRMKPKPSRQKASKSKAD
ncbi:hypothetical protein ARMGADRAFT_1169703 [Armillaria gallica]|uniref:Uncharacterized protein n=1 Tax=Armillaria gallica TaxID=47427 RepID=A0A2H3DAF2_ARMGA|nr:hypothetical protein ARMGADRAFT_1169703 [Armillaria gallica]